MSALFSFYEGPWENSTAPTIVRDDPEGGDPHILATLARVHNPAALHELCRAANDGDALLEKALEALECFEAAMTEGWIDALANGEVELVRGLWDRRLRYAHTLLLDMCS